MAHAPSSKAITDGGVSRRRALHASPVSRELEAQSGGEAEGFPLEGGDSRHTPRRLKPRQTGRSALNASKAIPHAIELNLSSLGSLLSTLTSSDRGSQDRIALIDAHQPAFDEAGGQRVFDLHRSIDNVVSSALRALGVPGVIVRDLLEGRREAWLAAEADG